MAVTTHQILKNFKTLPQPAPTTGNLPSFRSSVFKLLEHGPVWVAQMENIKFQADSPPYMKIPISSQEALWPWMGSLSKIPWALSQRWDAYSGEGWRKTGKDPAWDYELMAIFISATCKDIHSLDFKDSRVAFYFEARDTQTLVNRWANTVWSDPVFRNKPESLAHRMADLLLRITCHLVAEAADLNEEEQAHFRAFVLNALISLKRWRELEPSAKVKGKTTEAQRYAAKAV